MKQASNREEERVEEKPEELGQDKQSRTPNQGNNELNPIHSATQNHRLLELLQEPFKKKRGRKPKAYYE